MSRAEQLDAFLREAWDCAYLVGHWDCVMFVAAWADRISGQDHLATLQDTYTNEAEGRLRHAPGGISAAIRWALLQAGWIDVKRGDLAAGDIVFTNLEHPGIWDGEKIVAQPARAAGLLHVHPRHLKGGMRWA